MPVGGIVPGRSLLERGELGEADVLAGEMTGIDGGRRGGIVAGLVTAGPRCDEVTTGALAGRLATSGTG